MIFKSIKITSANELKNLNMPDFNSDQTAVLIFGASHFLNNPSLFHNLIQKFPKSHFIGCSTAGEIYQTEILDSSLVISFLKFDKTRIQTTAVSSKGKDSFHVGSELAKKLNSPDLKSILIYAEGVNINGSKLLEGMQSELNPSVTCSGGLAGDGKNFKTTWTLCNSDLSSNQVVGLGLYGDHIRVSHGSFGGWDIFGPERYITKSKDNILYELDGHPALELYKKYLGDKVSELPSSGLLFPLQIRESTDSNESVVRSILTVDEETQSLTFAGDMPQGYLAQLMRANFERIIDGAGTAATLLDIKSLEKPVACIAISCIGRRLVLGERAEEELEAVVDHLPSNSDLVGFYSYGEISPTNKDSKCTLHNQTMTITAIYEN